MSSSKKKKKHYKSAAFKSIVNTIAFVAAASAVMTIALLILNKPVTQLVHRLEQNSHAAVSDIIITDNYKQGGDDALSKDELSVGECFANITCESAGLNCDAYYGANQVSLRNGCGVSSSEDIFGSGRLVLALGYTETFFAPLELMKAGDIIEVSENSGSFSYVVSDVKCIDKSIDAYNSSDNDMLVLKGIYPDFSSHSGEYIYVFAQRAD